MIILRNKRFSGTIRSQLSIPPGQYSGGYYDPQNGKPLKNPRDSNAMVAAGKVGLGGAAMLGGAGAYQFGKALHQVAKAGKEGKIAKDIIANNPGIEKKLIGAINSGVNKSVLGKSVGGVVSALTGVPSEKVGQIAIDKGKDIYGAYKNLKRSPISRANFLWNTWNNISRAPRIVLLNSETAFNGAANSIIKNGGKKLTKEGEQVVRSAGKAAGHLANSGLYLKNSKGLFKGASALAGLGGLLYINGRSLQNPANNKQ